MIIGTNFIWLHFPKCAGTFTENLLKQLIKEQEKSIVFDKIDPNLVIWHQNVSVREKMLNINLSGKDILCNFRRLPYWIVSRIYYELNRSGNSTTKELFTNGQFVNRKGIIEHADTVLTRYTEREVKHWIRVESLEKDFIQVFSQYIDFKFFPQHDVFSSKLNVSGWDYNLKDWFSEKNLKELYESCPLWSKLEMHLYGDLLLHLP